MNLKNVSAWLLLLLTFKDGQGSLLNGQGLSYKLIRGNSSFYTVQDYENTRRFEYPRYNSANMQTVRQMWADYYGCLRALEGEETKPEIRRLLEGQYTELECVFCPKPFQDYDEIEWKYKPLASDADVGELEILDLPHEMTLTRNKTLRIYNAVVEFEGLYACYQKQSVLSVYVLEISKDDAMERVTTSSEEEEEDLATIDNVNFEIYYDWTEWTECSTCGRVGRKFRYGTCYISYLGGVFFFELNDTAPRETDRTKVRRSVDFLNLIQNIFNGKLFYGNSTLDESEFQNWRVQVIEKFATGIPCASRYLPRAAFDYAGNYVPMKVDVKYCLESCQKYELFEIFDADRKLIEVANNTAGIYSVYQELPPLPPNIERRSVTVEFGKDVVIQCPSTLLTTIPITWKINNEVILPEVVANDSNGRFLVDFVNRIHIKKLRIKDSHIYSCWQRNRLIGTVNLSVEKKFKVGFDHHVTLIALIIFLGILLLFVTNMITRELNNRKK